MVGKQLISEVVWIEIKPSDNTLHFDQFDPVMDMMTFGDTYKDKVE